MNAELPSPRLSAERRRSEEAAAELRAAGEALCRAAQIIAGIGPHSEQRPISGAVTSAPTPEERLSSKQLGAIRAASRRAGLSRDRLALLLEEVTGKEEPSALSRSEASSVLDKLSAMTGFTR
jgi:hypothetical protein